jgi:undecaprenyl-diphosphatase
VILLLEAALLGVVQGLTEFLPVSSSAHLILARAFFGWDSEQFGLPFDVACHVGTLSAILVYFRRDIAALLPGLARLHAPATDKAARTLWYIALATIPAVLVGGLLGDFIDQVRSPRVIAVTLAVGGLLMIAAERLGSQRRDADSLTLVETLAIGVAQASALIPGVSRSGATITMALALGLTRASGARFSFLLGIPAMLGAASLEGVKLATADLAMDAATAQVFLVGMVVSAVVGYLTVKFFLQYLVGHTLNVFALYRLLLAAATVIWLVA